MRVDSSYIFRFYDIKSPIFKEMHHHLHVALKNRNKIHALEYDGTFFVSRKDFDQININISIFVGSAVAQW